MSVGDAGAVTQQYLDRLLDDSRAGDLRDKPRTGDGRARFVRGSVCDSAGRPIGFRGLIRDITARKQTEAELRRAGAREPLIDAVRRNYRKK